MLAEPCRSLGGGPVLELEVLPQHVSRTVSHQRVFEESYSAMDNPSSATRLQEDEQDSTNN